MKQVILKKSKLTSLVAIIAMTLSLSVAFASNNTYEQKCMNAWKATSAAKSCTDYKIKHNSTGTAYIHASCKTGSPRVLWQEMSCRTILSPHNKEILNCDGELTAASNSNATCSEYE